MRSTESFKLYAGMLACGLLLFAFSTSGSADTGRSSKDERMNELLEVDGCGAEKLDLLDSIRVPGTAIIQELPSPELDHETASQLLNSPEASTTEIDVMVLYTSSAKAWVEANTPNEIDDFINQAVSDLNTDLAGSSIGVSARLVHAALLNGNETGVDTTDLLDLANEGGAYQKWDEVHALRNQKGADLVHLLVGTSNSCGIAVTLRPNTVGSGFSLSRTSCSLAQRTFSHEIGHTMGAGHENSAGFYPEFSKGWTFAFDVNQDGSIQSGETAGTVMARASAAAVRVPIFSSPLLSIAGIPLGTAIADNRLTIALLAGTVASYRVPVVPTCPGDANGDGQTTGADLSVLLSRFGQAVAPGSAADFNGDGLVNGSDLSVFLSNFGCGT